MASNASEKQQKFLDLLRELFQMDQADLDFGIYRIMNQKRDEINQFLEEDLLPQVKAAFIQYQDADKAGVQEELDKLITQLKDAGVDPEDSAKAKALQEQLANSVDIASLEAEVFSHLYNFFRRYYKEGDFISQRRYKEGVYAIPYEGEEVKLHYVKSSEYFRDYIFTMPSGKRVRVHLVAASTEQDNKKEQAGKERRFIICEENPTYEEDGELYIRFEYRSDDDKRKQADLNKAAIEKILAADNIDGWLQELSKPAPTKANPDRTVLERHLAQYTARNTFDYFIHKDLGGFLRRELDFYIKNEIMHLDDIEEENAPRVEQYLSKIKVMRKVANKIIQFLEQLENFQRKLWLKKKFVLETNYCFALASVPKRFYADIASNTDQIKEWKSLFSIEKNKADMLTPQFTEPVSIEFLESMPSLVIDTIHFYKSFTNSLLSEISDLDSRVCIDLIKGENFNSLSFATGKYQDRVGLFYNDPPYNTGQDGFRYRDNFQHSTWLSMFRDRLAISRRCLANHGVVISSINDIEHQRLRTLLDIEFGPENLIANMIWKGSTDNNPTRVAVEHEYLLLYAKEKSELDSHWYTSTNEVKQMMMEKYAELKESCTSLESLSKKFHEYALENREELGDLYRYRRIDEIGPYAARRNMDNPGKPGHTYDVYHPETGKPCAKPTWGWRFTESTMNELLASNRIIFGKTEEKIPELKVYLNDVRFPLRGVLSMDSRKGSNDLDRLFGTRDVFKNPKPQELIAQLAQFVTPHGSIVADVFAGSGTTGEAIVRLNREDGGRRKALLIEMDEVFDTVLLPRIKKCIYSQSWKSGIPTSPVSATQLELGPQIVRYLKLESYEDALVNLEPQANSKQQSLLETSPSLKEEYLLNYSLEFVDPSKKSLLNIAGFRNPDSYELIVDRDGENKRVKVDLVETFNWLLGLSVRHVDVIHNVRVVEGSNPNGERVLVLWRDQDEVDNDALDEWFKKQAYNTRDQDHDLIYVNGDNNLENWRRDDQTWKVRLIEEHFQRLMFDVDDV